MPVRWGGEVRFVGVAITHERRAYEPHEIELAETLANQAAVALALLEAERSRAASAEQDAALTRAAIALNASLELDEVLETLSREADLAVGGSLAGVYLADGSGGGVATAGHNTPEDWKGIVMARGEGIAGRVLETGRAFVTNAYQEEVELPPHPALRRLRTAVGLPMAWNGELKGALSVGFAEMRRVTDDDLRTLEAIAALAVAACRNAEAYEHASLAAITDALTGLLNHGALHLRIREEISRCRRTGTALTCLLLDLDNFKTVNDERGHLAGDDILRAVAKAMRGQLRDHDVVARYGGDEFVVLLPYTSAEGGRVVADRIAAGSPVPCSIGLAQWEDTLGADALLERADRALLLAKRTGKQRVTVADARLEDELDLTDARIGSPGAMLRDFWEMVAGSESARDALETLPAFLRRVTGAEEVALYELDGQATSCAGSTPTGARTRSSRGSRASAWPPAPRSRSGWRSGRSHGRPWPSCWPRSTSRARTPTSTPPPGPTPPSRSCTPATRRACSCSASSASCGRSGCARSKGWPARRWRCSAPARRPARPPRCRRSRPRSRRATTTRTSTPSRSSRSPRTSPACSASRPPTSSRCATARCCTTSASSRSRTRSSTSRGR